MTAVSPIEPAYAAPPRPTPADTTFEALYEQHSSRVFGYCLKWLRSREEAEDVIHLVNLRLRLVAKIRVPATVDRLD